MEIKFVVLILFVVLAVGSPLAYFLILPNLRNKKKENLETLRARVKVCQRLFERGKVDQLDSVDIVKAIAPLELAWRFEEASRPFKDFGKWRQFAWQNAFIFKWGLLLDIPKASEADSRLAVLTALIKAEILIRAKERSKNLEGMLAQLPSVGYKRQKAALQDAREAARHMDLNLEAYRLFVNKAELSNLDEELKVYEDQAAELHLLLDILAKKIEESRSSTVRMVQAKEEPA